VFANVRYGVFRQLLQPVRTIRLVRDIKPGFGSSYASDLVPMNGPLYFTAADQNGNAIWRIRAIGQSRKWQNRLISGPGL